MIKIDTELISTCKKCRDKLPINQIGVYQHMPFASDCPLFLTSLSLCVRQLETLSTVSNCLINRYKLTPKRAEVIDAVLSLKYLLKMYKHLQVGISAHSSNITSTQNFCCV